MAPDSGSSTVNINNEAHNSPDDVNTNGVNDRATTRSIPPWVITPDPNDGTFTTQPLQIPEGPFLPHHQYVVEDKHKKFQRGRRFDQYRTADPALLDQPLPDNSLRWLPFMSAGPQYQAADVEGARLMPDSWMGENVAWWSDEGQEVEHAPQEKRRTWILDSERRRGSVVHAKRTMLKNPYVPLVFRLVVTIYTIAALSLGVRVYHQTKAADFGNEPCVQRASTYMDVVVNAVAIPYIAYVTWDEYTAKPLGLRSATAKTALLLLDLYFIIFYGSNLTLAFDALTDRRWACYPSLTAVTCGYDPGICESQKALVAVLFVALLAWVVTFTVSVLRVVKKLRPDE